METSIKAYKRSPEFWVKKGKPQNYEGKFQERATIDIAIGQEKRADGSTYLILEPVFEDLTDMLFDPNITVYVDVYAYPKVVMVNKKNGKLIIHNPLVDYAKNCIIEILEDEDNIYLHNQIRALSDIRANRYASKKLSKSTKIIRETISIEMEERLNMDLLRIVLEEKFVPQPKDELERKMTTYKKDELISLHGGLLEYRESKKANFEPLKGLLEAGYEIGAIYKAYQKEISNRFYAGEIT